jgi:hypothetical protein
MTTDLTLSQSWPPAVTGKVTFTITIEADASADVDIQGAIGKGPYGILAIVQERLGRHGLLMTKGLIEVDHALRNRTIDVEASNEGPY